MGRSPVMRKFALFILALLFGQVNAGSASYVVSAATDDFLIRNGDMVNITVNLNSQGNELTSDDSGNSNICMKNCSSDSDLEFLIWVIPIPEGEVQIGPYSVVLGNETIKIHSLKIKVLPNIEGKPGIYINGFSDPNGSGKYRIRIDYVSGENVKFTKRLKLKESMLEHCKSGLFSHRGFESNNIEDGLSEYVLENVTDRPITIKSNDFIGLPDNYDLPNLVIPPSTDSTIRKKLAWQCQ
ncbi:MAG: hypothetical protein OEY09_15145 [Gammaproteobacteria bacterium]|nr:hypothetical protein [Gammaproteobacteria bacterium]